MRRTRMGLLSALVATFALVGGGMAEASHWWNGYKWATTDGRVEVYADLSDVKGEWAQVTSQVVEDWDRSGRIVLDTNPDGKQGVVTFASGNFPASGWLGLAMVQLDSRQRITRGRVLLNEWYWSSGIVEGLEARRHVACQEAGHPFGLDHQAGPSCMNDSPSELGSWVSPNMHDYVQLDTIYHQPDGYDSGTLSGSSVQASRARAPQLGGGPRLPRPR